MKARVLLAFLPLFLFSSSSSAAQQSTDSNQANPVAYAHLKSLTPTELKQLLSKAESGDAEAQNWVGIFYTQGEVPKDLEEGARWLLKSAEQGYAPAQLAFGLMSRLENPAVGERWMLRAGEQGDTAAQFWLGVAYEQNWFGTVDFQEAIKWFRKAAEGGNPDAQVELGERYEEGEGVEQNYALAAKCYRKAAEHFPNLGGAGQGRYRLAQLYIEGLGVPRDYFQAYFWLSLCDRETGDAKEHLSTDQIREADKLVKEWQEQHRVSTEETASKS